MLMSRSLVREPCERRHTSRGVDRGRGLQPNRLRYRVTQPTRYRREVDRVVDERGSSKPRAIAGPYLCEQDTPTCHGRKGGVGVPPGHGLRQPMRFRRFRANVPVMTEKL